MTDSTTGHVSPYHPGCKHRYSEHMDHNALIARLNDIADQQYKLLQLCNQLESNLNEHDNSETAHAYIRTIINNTSTRLGVIKAQIDADLATLRNTHTNDISTLTAADAAIQSRIDSLDDELDRVEREFTVNLTNIDHAINSNVSSGNLTNANSGTAIINGTAAAGYNMLYKGKSTHGKFTTGIDNTSYVVNYSADANNTNTPTYKATLLDENGNASFPNTVTATTFSGNATSATVANTAGKLTNSFNLSIQDASGNNSGAAVAVDGSRNVVLKMPDTLSNTNITGTANRAYADGNGANIADTYVHKTNVDETVAGTKSFSGTVKGNTIVPVTHAGATVGTNATPYENVYSTNFKGTNANINNITGNLTGNATSATKLQTARAINGTNFDGTGAITTEKWGTARNINVADASGTNSGAASSIDGSGNVTLKLPATIKANVTGNASTATQLSGSKKVNGTVFNGTSDITTEKWGTARNLSIADASGTNTGAATSVNGGANVTLKLPATIKGTLTGNADSATEFSSNATVAITGDATGTSAGSKKGWSVPITLANSGVVAGTYGPSGNVTGEDGVTISVPQITVDAKGRVTSVTNRTYTSVNNTDDVDWSLYPYKLDSISSYGHGRWKYINLENTDNNDFNSLVAPGKFQVRYNSNTLNAPVSDGNSHDGILEVDGTTSAAGASSYQRCYQRYTLYGSKPRQFIRKGRYLNGAWDWDSEWVELAKASDIPTKVSELTNDSGYLTSHQSLANYSTLANTVKSLSISGKTITVTPGSGSAYTLTTQDTVYTHPTTAGNKHIPSGGSSGQFLGWDSDGTAKWVNNPNTNTDTKVSQTVTTGDSEYPILAMTTASATATETNGARFSKGARVGTRYGILISQNTYNSDCYLGSTSGERSAGGMYGRDYNNEDLFKMRGMKYDSGRTAIRLDVYNKITSGAYDTAASATNAYWRFNYDITGKYIDTDMACGSNWNPLTTNSKTLGTSSLYWKACYATNFYGALTGNVTGNCSGSSGSCTGNAATATQFSENTTVVLTGDATGTSAGSKKGWSVPITLANSGVVAGTYGPSGNVTGEDGVTISVPQITVDAKGRVTSVTNRTYTSVNNGNDVDLSLYPYKVSAYSSYGNGRWPYRDLGDTTTYPNGFNEIVTTGKYQVRFTSSTPNSPYTVTSTASDGILEIEGISSAGSVSSYQRIVQRFYKYSSAHIVYFRAASYHDGQWNWSSSWTVYGDIVTHSASEFLTLSGAQTVSGTKTFSAIQYFDEYKLVVKATNQTVGTTPSSNKWNGMVFQDTAGTNTFTIENGHMKNGSTQLNLSCTPNISGAAKEAFLQYYCGTTEGASALNILTASATAPTPATDDNSTKIATTKWVKSQNYLTSHQSLTNYVTLNSAQIITNTKTFTAGIRFLTDNTTGTVPSSTYEKPLISYLDSTGSLLLRISTKYKTDKSSLTEISAYNTTVSGGGPKGSIGIGCDADGNVYTKAPTPATDDNSTKIATTAWVQKFCNTTMKYLTSSSISIPTKTSQLTNDSGFITISSVPTKTSQLTNDSGFLTSFSDDLMKYVVVAAYSFANFDPSDTTARGIANDYQAINAQMGFNSNYLEARPVFVSVYICVLNRNPETGSSPTGSVLVSVGPDVAVGDHDLILVRNYNNSVYYKRVINCNEFAWTGEVDTSPSDDIDCAYITREVFKTITYIHHSRMKGPPKICIKASGSTDSRFIIDIKAYQYV